MELTLRQLQEEHKEWSSRNFPDETGDQMLMGAMEELGELAHAQLKSQQNIREGLFPEQITAMKVDAVADIVIYLSAYCNAERLDFQHCLEVTWGKVKNRDWVADPEGVNAT